MALGQAVPPLHKKTRKLRSPRLLCKQQSEALLHIKKNTAQSSLELPIPHVCHVPEVF